MTQNDNMKNALQMFGKQNEFDTNVINATINDNDVITTLLNEYNANEYDIARNELNNEIDNMNDFLNEYNDIECNGIVENFAYYENELN